ncbi:MAG: phosphatidylglycerol lysyltransferase domain-containing protein [Endomicrobium sp.]|jgi:phosphatidylglycerol lysyltransferase|nr:phosphatidylglycerol lysyltransferase domain-containing protein [Endomicrobium sp.]
MKNWIKFFLLPIGFLIFVGALILLHNQLKNLSYIDIINALKAIPFLKIFLTMLFTLSYYIILGGYDIVAFKYINSKVYLKPKDILFTCFISNVLANNTGYSMLFGGSIRYRLYSLYNISMVDVTKVLIFSSATIWLGLLAVGGFVFTFAPVSLEGILNINLSTKTIGLFSILILFIYVFLSTLHSHPIKIFKWSITFPNIKIVLWQILLAILDWLVASLTLYILMPNGFVSYFVLLKVFLVTQFAVIISQVPGGIGIFETSITLLIPESTSNPVVIGALLAYRAIFYFFPLLIALVLLGSFELRIFTKKFQNRAKIFGKTISSVVVQVLALSSFIAGMVAMFSTATPFDVAQLKFIINLLPSWFADLSHFLLSVTSIILLFISRGLQLRIKKAWSIACILIMFAIILILIVGEPFLVFLCFVVLFIALVSSKQYFYRNISILNTAFSNWWLSAVCGVFVVSVWIGFFINKQDIFSWIHLDVFFRNILVSTTDAARFLRASFGMGVIIGIVVLEQVSRNFFRKPIVFTRKDIEKIVYSSDYVYSLNALSKDKNYMINEQKDAFIMYAKSGNSWIALGDPVGNSSHKNELLWQFKELADNVSAKPAFIGIDHKYVQIYDDIGLDIFNIGQEAKIQLKLFGKDDIRLRYFYKLEETMESLGFKYKIFNSEQFYEYKEIFANIDKEWRKTTNFVPINFIPGNYEPAYAKDMDFSIVEKDGKVYAFSVLEKTNKMQELSTGIVRYMPSEVDVFSYILFKNILWAKTKGYMWFDLGFAYFDETGIQEEVIKYFAKTFMFAEHFNYNLELLRNFKEKFCPFWHNKYIAIHPDKYILAFIKNFTKLIYQSKHVQTKFFFKRFLKK